MTVPARWPAAAAILAIMVRDEKVCALWDIANPAFIRARMFCTPIRSLDHAGVVWRTGTSRGSPAVRVSGTGFDADRHTRQTR
ncbi:hypothetical protein MBOT_03390 [Mycobacterium botniense]|uniref:Uncharacterized protein n=1 Tax=Mycobacterium botniense TaxID=84962 RepID=A0A7I9XSQ0_9MYCO|nr:hypothetical protein MBOT_03390 [Mycobacterium botniense]